MPTKTPKPRVPKKADDKEQSEAFIKAARDAEASEDPEAFERAFRTVSKAGSSKKKTSAKG